MAATLMMFSATKLNYTVNLVNVIYYSGPEDWFNPQLSLETLAINISVTMAFHQEIKMWQHIFALLLM